jgi:NAD(P)-dependent dehydrogenase (short-subunit alcohol dehydrogenase family)
MMSVNVDGVVFGLQTLLPLLAPGAAIVVTASLAGVTPYAIDPLYAMSKHAVVGLVRSLAPELARRGIRIHALCPGAVATEIIPHAQKTNDALFMAPEDLAKDVVELMEEPESGKSWVRLRADKPRYVIRAPGDKTR